MSSHAGLRALTVTAAIGALAVTAASSDGSSPSTQAAQQRHGARQPAALHGTPLPPSTGLRLLVADTTPFVLDVDTGTDTPIGGVEMPHGGVLTVTGIAGKTAFVAADPLLAGTSSPRYAREWNIYAVAGGSPTASSLGKGSYDLVPRANGTGVWIKQMLDPSHCRLQGVGPDLRVRVTRALPCSWTLAPGGSLGLIANRTRVFDPWTGRTVVRTKLGVLAAAGRRLLLAGPGNAGEPGFKLRLLDVTTGAERTVRWPSIIGQLDEPAVDPRGRYIAIGFGDPAWDQGPEQVLDVWVLDARTGALTHLPGMPAYVHLKFTSMQWTQDGRLVLLGQDDERAFVAVWHRGQRKLAIKSLQIPQRTGGSDAFAVLR